MRRLVPDHLEDILENALAARDFVGQMNLERYQFMTLFCERMAATPVLIHEPLCADWFYLAPLQSIRTGSVDAWQRVDGSPVKLF